MFGKKGQGAMEYLMTYGWAILVVMIVGIVMWQLGIFNMGSTSVTASGFSKLKPLLTGCKMTSGATGAFTCTFTNGAGGTIKLAAPVAWTGSTSCTVTAGSPPTSTPITQGSNLVLAATGCKGGSVGDSYAININFTYIQTVAGVDVTHIDNGIVRGPYE